MKHIPLLPLLFFWTFSVQLLAQSFTQTAASSGLTFSREYLYNIGGGVSIVDYDNDGWEDILLPGGFGLSALYKNNGDGTFADVTQIVFNPSTISKLDSLLVTSSVVGDIDNDGDKDLFLTTSGYKIHNGVLTRPHVLLENLGDGTFADISVTAGFVHSVYGEAATMGDYNLDGYLDIYISNYVHSMDGIFDNDGVQIGYVPECIANSFYINNGNKTFTESASLMGINDEGCALTSCFTDFDFDHDVDLLLANDFGEWSIYPNANFVNNYPDNSFSSQGGITGFNRPMYGMGIAPGDYNEDGHMDYYVTNIGSNSLYKNNGDGTFSDVALSLGVDNTWSLVDSLRNTSWGCVFLDIDNDTYLDLFVSTGSVLAFIPMTTLADSNRLYRNDGTGNFVDISGSSGITDIIGDRGAASFDYDHDGDLDLVSNHAKLQIYNAWGIDQNLHLYRNENNNGNNWLKVKLQGTTNNRDAYGSRVKVFIGNRSLIREIDGGSSHASINSPIAHFGLGESTQVDSVQIFWLGGVVQTIYNVDANQMITVIEGLTSGLSTMTLNPLFCHVYPNPSDALSDLNMEIYSPVVQSVTITVTSILGSVLYENETDLMSGYQILKFDDWLNNTNVTNQFVIIKITDSNQCTLLTNVFIR